MNISHLTAILSIIITSVCSSPTQDNRKVIQNLRSDSSFNVNPIAMTYINNEFVMLLSTLHLYRGPRECVKIGEGSLRIELDPRRLYDLSKKSTLFFSTVCPTNNCGAQQKTVVLFKKTINDVSTHYAGVVTPKDKSDTKELMVFYLANFTKAPFHEPYHSFDLIHAYRVMDEAFSYSYIVQDIDNVKDVYMKMNPPVSLYINKPEHFSFVKREACTFVFVYEDSQAVFYNRTTKMFHFRHLNSIVRPDYTNSKGIDLRRVYEEDEHKKVQVGYYAIFSPDLKKALISNVFDLKDVGDGDIIFGDIDKPYPNVDEKYPSIDSLFNRKLLVFITILLLCILILTTISVLIILKKRRHNRKLLLQKQTVVIVNHKNKTYPSSNSRSTMSVNIGVPKLSTRS